MVQKSDRVVYLDYLKILAMFAVVLLHVAAGRWNAVEETSYEWQILNMYDSIVRWAVPVFVMVSGALFLDEKRKLDLRRLYSKNIFRIITCFIFWSVLYAMISWLRGMKAKEVILSVIRGNYHMWFLFMIVGLYILVPLLRKITESKKLMEYFLILVLVFTFIIPRGLQFFGVLELPHTVDLIKAIQTAYSKVHFHFTLGFVGYFVAGYYFRKYEISKRIENLIYVLGIVGFLSTIFLSSWYSLREGQQSTMFYSEFSITVMLEALAVFTFAKCKLSKIAISEKIEKRIHYLAQYGFGIYLVHVAILDSLRLDFQIHALTYNPLFMVPLLTLGVWLISLVISFILNHIPIIKKYIV